jgi:pimeloyl-ACP methyl ester carboxylesterase
MDDEMNDPLCYTGLMRIRTGISIKEAVDALPPILSRISVPILVQHGMDDRVCAIEVSKQSPKFIADKVCWG